MKLMKVYGNVSRVIKKKRNRLIGLLWGGCPGGVPFLIGLLHYHGPQQILFDLGVHCRLGTMGSIFLSLSLSLSIYIYENIYHILYIVYYIYKT